MNRHAGTWFAAAVFVLGLAVLSMIFGATLLPSRATAQEAGTIVPWFLTWGMALSSALISVVLAGYLVMLATGRVAAE